jgi:predicted deacylase
MRRWSGFALALAFTAGQAAAQEDAPPWPPLSILGDEVAPGQRRRLELALTESFSGSDIPTPVVVIRGAEPGPTLCLIAGIHGDEVNGIEIVRRLVEHVEPEGLRGTILAVPIVNLPAFRRGSRYLPDRRDLNRYFPGSPTGSVASRMAHAFFDKVIRRCDALVDMHTGSFHRANLFQVRADLSRDDILELARGFDAVVVVNNRGQLGTLRRAASDAGIPAVTIEAGEPTRFLEREVDRGVVGIEGLLSYLGMRDAAFLLEEADQMIYYKSSWVRSEAGGILSSRVALGERVTRGQVLGLVTNPISSKVAPIHSPYDGRVIGMALDQLVMPGFAAFHVALDSEERISSDERFPQDLDGVMGEEAHEIDVEERNE